MYSRIQLAGLAVLSSKSGNKMSAKQISIELQRRYGLFVTVGYIRREMKKMARIDRRLALFISFYPHRIYFMAY